MKKFFLILGIIGGALLTPLYLFVVSGAFAILMPNPPEPQIKYGEFLFTITYEIDGEIKTYEDILICEYAGIEDLGTAGKYRKWSKRLKSGNERIVLLQGKEDNSSFQLCADAPTFPEYFMGDFSGWRSKDEYETTMKDERDLSYIQQHDGVETGSVMQKDEAWRKYRIRIISIEFPPPIENTFIDPETGAIVDYRGDAITDASDNTDAQ